MLLSLCEAVCPVVASATAALSDDGILWVEQVAHLRCLDAVNDSALHLLGLRLHIRLDMDMQAVDSTGYLGSVSTSKARGV